MVCGGFKGLARSPSLSGNQVQRMTENKQTTMSNCPFGPAMEKYWARLSPEEKQMRLDREALYSLVVQPAALRTASITPGQHVVDAFCGAGGSTIGFARAGKRVTAIEMNPERLEMARYNADLFGVSDRITFLQGDSLEILPRLAPSTVFLAPPWGGPEYAQQELFTLDAFSPNGHVLLNLALTCGESVVMQLPRNFDLNQFKPFRVEVTLSEDLLNGELLSYTAVLQSIR